MSDDLRRWSRATIDLDAVAHNVSLLRAAANAHLWAVVKADGYGHGAVGVAQAALDAGANGLCVALVQEAVELRHAGIAARILVLTEQPTSQYRDALLADAQLVVYNDATVDAIGDIAAKLGRVAPVHVHVDTGMHRVGVSPDRAVDLMRRIDAHPHIERVGTMTHLACADEPTTDATDRQLDVFDRVLARAVEQGLDVGMVHAANSAATLAFERAHYDMVRAGIALYGISPGPGVDALGADLRPAMTLSAKVSHVARVEAGDHVSYGWRYRVPATTTLATVPIGYADGVRRALGSPPGGGPGFPVLIGGRRCPIVGVVTMDQLVVDVGNSPVAIGDDVVLIGRQGGQEIRSVDWAAHLGTIGYEVVCDISARVPRAFIAAGASDSAPSPQS